MGTNKLVFYYPLSCPYTVSSLFLTKHVPVSPSSLQTVFLTKPSNAYFQSYYFSAGNLSQYVIRCQSSITAIATVRF